MFLGNQVCFAKQKGEIIMKRAASIIVAVLIAFGMGLLFINNQKAEANLLEPTIEFGDSCKNIRFSYKNGTNKFIQIIKVKFYNKDETDWKTETIPFNYCSPNQSNCSMPQQDLQGSEGDSITKVIFEFRTSNSYQGPWSISYESQEFHPNSPKCNAGRSYGSGTDWVVTANDSANNTSGDSGSCKNVSIKITNGRNEKIRFREVSFYNKSSDHWKDDNVAKTECLPEQTCTINQEDNALARTPLSLTDANGDDITKIKIGYEYLPNGRGAKWSSKIESKVFEPSDPTCREGKVFGTGQKWTIGNDSSSNTGGSRGTRPTETTTNSETPRNQSIQPQTDINISTAGQTTVTTQEQPKIGARKPFPKQVNPPTNTAVSISEGSRTTTTMGQPQPKTGANPRRRPAKVTTDSTVQPTPTNSGTVINSSPAKVATPAPKPPVRNFPRKKKP